MAAGGWLLSGRPRLLAAAAAALAPSLPLLPGLREEEEEELPLETLLGLGECMRDWQHPVGPCLLPLHPRHRHPPLFYFTWL